MPPQLTTTGAHPAARRSDRDRPQALALASTWAARAGCTRPPPGRGCRGRRSRGPPPARPHVRVGGHKGQPHKQTHKNISRSIRAGGGFLERTEAGKTGLWTTRRRHDRATWGIQRDGSLHADTVSRPIDWAVGTAVVCWAAGTALVWGGAFCTCRGIDGPPPPPSPRHPHPFLVVARGRQAGRRGAEAARGACPPPLVLSSRPPRGARDGFPRGSRQPHVYPKRPWPTARAKKEHEASTPGRGQSGQSPPVGRLGEPFAHAQGRKWHARG